LSRNTLSHGTSTSSNTTSASISSNLDPSGWSKCERPMSSGSRQMKLRPGVLHGTKSYVLQDADGQTSPVHSVSAGLDYPGVGPQHSFLKESGRAEYVAASDAEVLDAFQFLTHTEGIIPALESAHAVAYLMRPECRLPADRTAIVCLSGRGDKDLWEVSRLLALDL